MQSYSNGDQFTFSTQLLKPNNYLALSLFILFTCSMHDVHVTCDVLEGLSFVQKLPPFEIIHATDSPVRNITRIGFLR